MKKLALIAHDNKKADIVAQTMKTVESLKTYTLYGTRRSAELVEEATGLKVEAFLGGPYGGDLEIGAEIATRKIDIVVFFWDPLCSQPHDPDVKALMRIAAVYDIPFATNRATADLILGA